MLNGLDVLLKRHCVYNLPWVGPSSLTWTELHKENCLLSDQSNILILSLAVQCYCSACWTALTLQSPATSSFSVHTHTHLHPSMLLSKSRRDLVNDGCQLCQLAAPDTTPWTHCTTSHLRLSPKPHNATTGVLWYCSGCFDWQIAVYKIQTQTHHWKANNIVTEVIKGKGDGRVTRQNWN